MQDSQKKTNDVLRTFTPMLDGKKWGYGTGVFMSQQGEFCRSEAEEKAKKYGFTQLFETHEVVVWSLKKEGVVVAWSYHKMHGQVLLFAGEPTKAAL